MAAENNSNKIQEKGILYDLDIPYEWPETVTILVRIFRVFYITRSHFLYLSCSIVVSQNDNDYQSLYKILTAAVNGKSTAGYNKRERETVRVHVIKHCFSHIIIKL